MILKHGDRVIVNNRFTGYTDLDGNVIGQPFSPHGRTVPHEFVRVLLPAGCVILAQIKNLKPAPYRAPGAKT